jgi:molybdopterin-containing oxidoreductase family iron-sulfur binding subunit
MKITRKEFLRWLGFSALAAGCGKAVADPAPGSQPSVERSPRTNHPRWGMAIDFQKCREDSGCEQCLSACKRAHNIPDIPERAHEVKWIWKEPFEKAFPSTRTTTRGRHMLHIRYPCCVTTARNLPARGCAPPGPRGSEMTGWS